MDIKYKIVQDTEVVIDLGNIQISKLKGEPANRARIIINGVENHDVKRLSLLIDAETLYGDLYLNLEI